MAVIDAIVGAISSVNVGGGKVKVLNVDPGAAANRTVVTFVGEPEVVLEAAFQGAKCASQLIDMRLHHGTHPRSGAIDVLPLIPVSDITLQECANLARDLAKRMFVELGIPCYCYEASAFRPERTNLAVCRAGEYEALPEKIADPERRPDFTPDSFNEVVARTGASNVGARNFLIAVNFNLNTAKVESAMSVAREVRESGYHSIPGTLKGCKAIGWYIEEYGVAQVSMNITDIVATPLHKAYEEVCRVSESMGLKVTGTEIIGLVPRSVLLDAGRHFLTKRHRQADVAEEDLINTAITSMGLDDLKPFNPAEKVISF